MMQNYEIRITSQSEKKIIDLKELWDTKDLFFVLSWRNFSLRYNDTFLGVTWVIIQPLLMMVIFTVVFHQMAGVKADYNVPYPLFFYVGWIFWQFTSNTINFFSNALLVDAELIKKVYFPRVFLPASCMFSYLVDFLIGLLFLIPLMIFYGFYNVYNTIFILFLLVPLFCFIMGLGLFLSALIVKYRDMRFVLAFFLQVLLYLTPVIYSLDVLNSFQTLKCFILWANPLAGIITAARNIMFNHAYLNYLDLTILVEVCYIIFLGGLYYFCKIERTLCDSL